MKYILTLLFALLLSGCVSAPYLEKQRYALNAKNTTQFKLPVIKENLMIESTASTPEFRNNNFVYRTHGDRYLEDFYNGFVTSPAQQIKQATYRWFMSNQFFQHTLTQDLQLDARYTLKSKLLALYADYSQANSPASVISVEYIFIDNTNNKILLDKTYDRRVTLSKKSTGALLDSWNTGMKMILNDLTQDIFDQLLPGKKLDDYLNAAKINEQTPTQETAISNKTPEVTLDPPPSAAHFLRL